MKFARYALSLILLLAATAGRAQVHCVVCKQTPNEPHFLFGSPSLRGRLPVCKPCSQLTTVCNLCSLPVKTNFLQLDDGRFLCEAHRRIAIFSETDALRTFEETKREMFRLLAGKGVLPSRNITVQLVNGLDLKKLHQSQRSVHDQMVTMGLTRTRQTGRHDFQHTIYLLNGLSRARLMAVCAHEYTHTWLHENVPEGRQLEADAVEGFCELTAYHLMGQMGEDLEQQVILANNYTRGQINALVKAAKEHEFYRVVEWIKSGRDGLLGQSDTSRLLALNEPPPPPLFPWTPQPLPPMPDRLELHGISGTARRRFALINGRTLEKNEEARVRIGTSNVIVRCLDISDRSAWVSVNGSTERTELTLRTE